MRRYESIFCQANPADDTIDAGNLDFSIFIYSYDPGRSGENNGRTGCRTIRSRGDSRRVRIKRSADRAVCELYERFVYRRPWKKFKI